MALEVVWVQLHLECGRERLRPTVGQVVSFMIEETWRPTHERDDPGLLAMNHELHEDRVDGVLCAHKLVERVPLPRLVCPRRLLSDLPANLLRFRIIESLQRQQCRNYSRRLVTPIENPREHLSVHLHAKPTRPGRVRSSSFVHLWTPSSDPSPDCRWTEHQHVVRSSMTGVELRNRSGEILVSDLQDTGEQMPHMQGDDEQTPRG